MRATGEPVFFFAADIRRHTAMFPDRAVAQGCVTCHNEHPNTTKGDWNELHQTTHSQRTIFPLGVADGDVRIGDEIALHARLKNQVPRNAVSSGPSRLVFVGHPHIPIYAVRLTGSAAIVTGNHIKSTPRRAGYFSVNFNNMPGPLIGNVYHREAVNHVAFPAPENAFNILMP